MFKPIVCNCSELRRLYRDMSLTDGGIREDKYRGVRWKNILKNKVNLWVCLLCSSDSHPTSLYKAVIEISLVVPVAMRAASSWIFFF